ncbi:TetR/AcrR family transcriptional regulator [Amycolatopsis pithecellobii]|uniref:TetR/AcrR family transcriptional regulator n=1 Tax=Amycolatopsis pithecellobii TaxID=664692 RepID=UPI0012B82D1D|nr:TetR/AcrR family transcriptional regulator [Amycolatopsis pithecellobii]
MVRADAKRNRQRLIEVARRAFGASEGKVSLEAIAREAGVGIGTLYRHFPTREALVEALYGAERAQLCDSADELLAAAPPDRALRAWMDRFGEYFASKREMAGVLRAMAASGAVDPDGVRAELAAAAARLLDAGAAAGTLRDDVRAEDVVAALVGTFLVCDEPGRREQAGRLLDLLMDSLRPR